jgi:hypothetical protein
MATGSRSGAKDKNLLRVFCPYVRALSHEEVSGFLPPEKRKSIEAGDEGVWLEVLCPKDECLKGSNKIVLPVRRMGRGESEDLWLNVFCPEDECVISSPTDLP